MVLGISSGDLNYQRQLKIAPSGVIKFKFFKGKKMKDKNGIKIIVKEAPINPSNRNIRLNLDSAPLPEESKIYLEKNIRNLNSHIIRVIDEFGDITYPAAESRPRIDYIKIPDKNAPGCYIMKTSNITGLPYPKKDVLLIVNRDIIRSSRTLSRSLRKIKKFNKAFRLVSKYPDNWRTLVQQEFSQDIFKPMLKFVNRHDLRAPGEQVRLKDNKISHCTELISDYE